MNYLIMQAAAPATQGNMLMSILPFALMIAVVYFLIMRPQQKKQKEHAMMLENLKTHDVVVTTGGIIGKIANVKKEKNIVVLKVDDNTKIEIQRHAIAGLINEKSEEKK